VKGHGMKFRRHRFLRPAAGAAARSVISAIFVVLIGHGAWSQTTRTIKVVVPFAPGGIDSVARLLGDQISRARGLTVVVENRPGAGSVIGTEAVARATPDGNTVLMIANSL
jgi:tripartite-type tricarboxylate transporter receptor subunit TctC